MRSILTGIKTTAVINVGTHAGGADRRRRLRPTDPHWHPPRRYRVDPAGRDICDPARARLFEGVERWLTPRGLGLQARP